MANIQALGELINWVDVRNKGVISDNLLGINIDKFFMPSVANIIGTDLSSYKLIRKKQFACNPMHVGRDEKMPIALYMDDSPSIVSPAYFVFEIKDAAKVNPEYLMLWFRRAEFDRECWYHTDGSVRGGITWDEILEMTVPVPSIEEQNELVKSYRDIERRIQIKKEINDNLEAQAFAIYKEYTRSSNTKSSLSDIAIITMGTSPDGETFNTEGLGDIFYQGRTDFGFRFPTIRLFTTDGKRFAKAGDVLMSVRAPVGDVNIAKEDCAIGRGLASIRPKDGCRSFLYYTMQELNFELNKFNDEGTVFGSITKDDLYALKVITLDTQTRENFERIVAPIDDLIKANEYELSQLTDVCSTLLSKLVN